MELTSYYYYYHYDSFVDIFVSAEWYIFKIQITY